MAKIILLAIIAWLVITLLKKGISASKAPPGNSNSANDDMVPCAVCGVHIPKQEAITSQGSHYCCEAHFLARKR